MKIDKIHEALHEDLRQMQNDGIDVYAVKYGDHEVSTYTYAYFTDGKNIGYIQVSDYFKLPEYATVHQPNRQTGDGFKLDDTKNYRDAFVVAPGWASHEDRMSVKKYDDFASFVISKANRGGGRFILID